ncbi:TRAP transporter large permease [Mangrovicoccus algicola]|uniref:TRAP transporter large permease protein n=1 Tax=Mangrovicoccus algicola TaxID=2771008 RepID=A0A8J6YTK5_9RHOB|nr:TRAP transporter large permease [Mangrovicoccus algicola]MBE3637267.1 TRAP transporter large permease [Mangrovicoccus algicola]
MTVLALFSGLLVLGLPVAFAILAAALWQIAATGNPALFLSVPQQLFAGIESYGLLALPVFILLGELMNAAGAGRRLLALAALAVGPVRGGLAQVTLVANAMMAAILGSSVAQITLMSKLAVPEMERAGYPRDLAAAVTAAGGLLAPVLPPSMLLILFGVTAQIPVGELFVAGVVPGLLLFAALAAVTAAGARRRNLPVARRPATGRGRIVLAALPSALVPLAMIASILGGIATAVEAGTFGILATLVVGFAIHRELRVADLWPALKSTALTSAVILMLVAAAGLWSWIAAWQNLPAQAGALISGLTSDPLVFMLLYNLMLILIGMVIDPIPALILVVPVFLPIATGSYGFDPLQMGVVTCLNLTLGLLTPPVGSGLFTAARLNGVRPERLARLTLPYLAAGGAVILLTALWPAVSGGLGRLLN